MHLHSEYLYEIHIHPPAGFFHISGLSWMCHIFRFGPTDAKQKSLGHPLAQNGRYGSDSPFGWPKWIQMGWPGAPSSCYVIHMVGIPLYRWMVYFMGNPIKMDDWGYPFQEPHIYIYIYTCIYIYISHDFPMILALVYVWWSPTSHHIRHI